MDLTMKDLSKRLKAVEDTLRPERPELRKALKWTLELTDLLKRAEVLKDDEVESIQNSRQNNGDRISALLDMLPAKHLFWDKFIECLKAIKEFEIIAANLDREFKKKMGETTPPAHNHNQQMASMLALIRNEPDVGDDVGDSGSPVDLK